MPMPSRRHLSDAALRESIQQRRADARRGAAEKVADIAEFDRRKLWREDGYSSMYSYCVHVLHLPEGAAYKRIQVAHAARNYAGIYDALVDGRLHLTAVYLLAPHLRNITDVAELIEACTHRTRRQIERLIAQRFPTIDLPARVIELPATSSAIPSLPPGANLVALPPGANFAVASPASLQLSPGTVASEPTAPPPPLLVTRPATPGRVDAIAPKRYAVQFTFREEAHAKLERAKELLGNTVPAGDLAEIFERALDLLIAKEEHRQCGATSRPRRTHRASTNPRHIPAHVRRAVTKRDQGQCTFVSDSGQRCEARSHLQYDHVTPIARGGTSTVVNVRLLCHEHNQLAAERAFGAAFMEARRMRAGSSSVRLDERAAPPAHPLGESRPVKLLDCTSPAFAAAPGGG